jgi:hypothetical protein
MRADSKAGGPPLKSSHKKSAWLLLLVSQFPPLYLKVMAVKLFPTAHCALGGTMLLQSVPSTVSHVTVT